MDVMKQKFALCVLTSSFLTLNHSGSRNVMPNEVCFDINRLE